MNRKNLLSHNGRWAAFLMLPALLFAGCRKSVEWSHTVAVPADGWNSESPVIFSLDPQAYLPKNADRFKEMTDRAMGDTLPRLHGPYRAILSLRYLDDCNAASLRLVVESASLERDIHTDTITVPLFGPDGRPLGAGRFGLNEVSATFPAPFEVSAGSILTVTPVDYSTPVTGLQYVTLILENEGASNKPLIDCKSAFLKISRP